MIVTSSQRKEDCHEKALYIKPERFQAERIIMLRFLYQDDL